MKVDCFTTPLLIVLVLAIAPGITPAAEDAPRNFKPMISHPSQPETVTAAVTAKAAAAGAEDSPEKLKISAESAAPPNPTSFPVIDPALQLEAATATELDVYVFLATESKEGESALRAVKDRHRPIVENLSSQIQDIERRYRPSISMPRDQEDAWILSIEESISDEDKEQREQLRLELDAALHAMRQDLAQAIRKCVDATQQEVALAIEEMGGKIDARVLTSNLLLAALPATALDDLGVHPLVRRIVPRREGEPCLNVSAPSCGYPTFWGNGFTGGAYDAGIADTGFQEDHPAFSGMAILRTEPDPVDPDGHGTHVGGIIVSGDTTFRGTAYGLDAFFWGKAGGHAFATLDAFANDFGDSPEVANMSWAYSMANVEDYNYEDEWFDTYVEAFDIMVTLAAGNYYWDDVYPTIVHPAAGFNPITVANMDGFRTLTRVDDLRSNDSSVGPTLNGRRKPDISAHGTNIVSTHAFWAGGGTGAGGWCDDSANHNDFSFCGGTSMAAPHVAGAILLLHDGGVFDSMAQKAVLFNTADWWTSNNTATRDDDAPVGTPSGVGTTDWDRSYGWGLLDMEHAFLHLTDYFTDSVIPRNNNSNEDDYKLFAGTLNVGEKVTLVWEKRGVYDPDKYVASTYALSDLDLYLYDADTGELVDYDITAIDNVHQVAPESMRNVVVKVEAYSTAFDGAATEPFALATEEGFTSELFPDPLALGGIWPSDPVEPNEEFDVNLRLTNYTSLASHGNQLELILPTGWTLLESDNPQDLGSVPGGLQSDWASWRVRAQGTPQAEVLLEFEHSHSSYGESYGPQKWYIELSVAYDFTPPSPDPMTWEQAPFGFSDWGIEMMSTPADDIHPVEYEFDFFFSTTGSGGGSSSGWRPGRVYIDDGLDPNGEYCYRVRARDVTTYGNMTGFSSTECAWTGIEPVTGISVTDVGRDRITVQALNTPTGLTRGISGIEFFDEGPAIYSGWRQDTGPHTFLGLAPNTLYGFRGYSRNAIGQTTAPSVATPRYTLASPPVPLGFSNIGPHQVQVDLDPLDENPENTEYLIYNVPTLQNSGWGGTEWLNEELECGTNYWYVARAVNGDGIPTEWIELGDVTTPIDQNLDGDPVPLCGGDCDDGNASVYPEAPELCDGLDNDCDSFVDEDNHDGDWLPDCVDPDDDNDGVIDVQDCAPLDGTVWSLPEIEELFLTANGEIVQLTWPPPMVPAGVTEPLYDTLSSYDAGNYDPSSVCVEYHEMDRFAQVATPLDPGQVLFLLVRGVNGCGSGPAGYSSAGIPRQPRDCP